jgi:sensor histidine kinase regulating citrate/malate metabolism
MKSLVAILFLINCLAFFMFKHMQKQSELSSEEVQMQKAAVVASPQAVALLSELSAEQLKALNPEFEAPVQPSGEPFIEVKATAGKPIP